MKVHPGTVAWTRLAAPWRGAACAIAFLLAAAAGCQRGAGPLDAQDQGMPLMARAAILRDGGDTDGAIDAYERALLAHPDAARAHLDLALLLHDRRQDAPGAIYHYRAYLKLRPDTEKRDIIESRVKSALELLAGQASQQSSNTAATVEALQRENTALRLELDQVRRDLTAARRGSDSRTGGVASMLRTYRVQKGDTLASIAAEVYGDANKWKQIYDANKTVIPNRDVVPVGTLLIIP